MHAGFVPVPRYWPRTTSLGNIGVSDRNILFFSSEIAIGSSAVGGSIATNAITWNRWVTTMSQGAGGFVECTRIETEGLGNVHLYVPDEVPVPDGLETGRWRTAAPECSAPPLPRKWSIRKICSSANVSCRKLLSLDRRLQVFAERLLHDDARPLEIPSRRVLITAGAWAARRSRRNSSPSARPHSR